MWVFLSSRLRSWLFLAVAIPLVRRVLARLTAARAAAHPDARSTSALRRADSTLGRIQRKPGRRRKG